MATIGDTIKLRVEFRDFNDNFCDPETIVLNIYDSYRNKVLNGAEIGATNKIAVGIYEYLFTIPDGVGDLVYEFTGEIEGNPSVDRGIIVREWV